jgi:hypothetical protein
VPRAPVRAQTQVSARPAATLTVVRVPGRPLHAKERRDGVSRTAAPSVRERRRAKSRIMDSPDPADNCSGSALVHASTSADSKMDGTQSDAWQLAKAER